MTFAIRCPSCSRAVPSGREQMMWRRSVSYDEYDRYTGHGLNCLNDFSLLKCPCGHEALREPCFPLAAA